MELRYWFDAERFVLGRLCVHGHRWPGTDLSLRRNDKRAPNCAGCQGRKSSSWLISFIDYKASGFEPGKKLGKLCPAGHKWNGQNMSLRYAGSGGHCVECIRLKSLAVPAEKKKQWSDAYLQRIGKDEICRRNQERYANMTPEQRQARVEYKRQVRERLRQQGLTASGRQPVNASALVPKAELCRMAQERRDRQRAAAKARRQEREAQRAMREQDPEWQAKHKEEKRMNQLIRYALDEDFRLYNREKSKRRKATIKERHAVRVKSRDIRARFAQFNGCAYCGTHGDMHMDHFIPLARGGTHALGNLVPACPSCNYSKTDHDPEQWYRAQPFFTEKRWRKILQVLCVKRGSPLQLALL